MELHSETVQPEAPAQIQLPLIDDTVREITDAAFLIRELLVDRFQSRPLVMRALCVLLGFEQWAHRTGGVLHVENAELIELGTEIARLTMAHQMEPEATTEPHVPETVVSLARDQ
jgi:hypothetical protein